jgi:hypothetical protein
MGDHRKHQAGCALQTGQSLQINLVMFVQENPPPMGSIFKSHSSEAIALPVLASPTGGHVLECPSEPLGGPYTILFGSLVGGVPDCLKALVRAENRRLSYFNYAGQLG